MMTVIASLLLAAFVVLMAAILIFAYACGIIWWRNRRPPEVFIEQMPRYEWSDRERRIGQEKGNGPLAGGPVSTTRSTHNRRQKYGAR